jgi:hypothetical protein
MKAYLIAILAATGLATCACGGSTPAAAPSATVTVTQQASGEPSTPAATTQPAVAASSAAPSGCLTRYLYGSAGLSQGTAGSVMVVIQFKNLDNVPCTLYGFPGVAQATGKPITDVGQPSTENPSTPRQLVTLQPGGYANATLQIADAGNFPAAQCASLTVHWLAVIPPNQTVPLYIHYTSVACKGTAKLLQVTSVSPGNGG